MANGTLLLVNSLAEQAVLTLFREAEPFQVLLVRIMSVILLIVSALRLLLRLYFDQSQLRFG